MVLGDDHFNLANNNITIMYRGFLDKLLLFETLKIQSQYGSYRNQGYQNKSTLASHTEHKSKS